jgi:hypothetical protein
MKIYKQTVFGEAWNESLQNPPLGSREVCNLNGKELATTSLLDMCISNSQKFLQKVNFIDLKQGSRGKF